MAGSIHRRSLKEGARMERPEEKINRGDIYYAYLEPAAGSEQSGIRPVVIVQNDTGNHFSPTVIIAAISSKEKSVFYLLMYRSVPVTDSVQVLWSLRNRSEPWIK